MSNHFDFFNEDSLVSRLTRALSKRPQEVVFLLGAPLSAPTVKGGPGVPGVDGIIEMISSEFVDDPDEISNFRKIALASPASRYQASFRFLQGSRGQSVANQIVRRAVLSARVTDNWAAAGPTITDDDCRALEADVSGWCLTPGTDSIGRLVSEYPQFFGKAILTTNFDPMIKIAITKWGGQQFRTTLHSDGDLHQTEAPGCHVVHLHGYWHGSDTLHTARQLVQERPRLKASLTSLLRDKLLVVCGYGGWDDVFTRTLLDLVRDDTAGPEILWTFYSDQPLIEEKLADEIEPGVGRGRVSLYSGIDCNSLFPKILSAWQSIKPVAPIIRGQSNPVRVPDNVQKALKASVLSKQVLEGDDEDRPPIFELCLGREHEIEQLEADSRPVVYITGFGGQGKSTLAAKYFSDMQDRQRFKYFIWRDCKEESERFENQIAAVVETLSGGVLNRSDLAKQPIQELIDTILARLKSDFSVLFIFDNLDHLVNLETGRLTAAADLFAQALADANTSSRVVFTCRPEITDIGPRVVNLRLSGISESATRNLFLSRGVQPANAEIERAHTLTQGHAFWLDLLSLQARDRGVAKLSEMLDRISATDAVLPEAERLFPMLNQVWDGLEEKPKLLLRAMAETVRPEREAGLEEYLRSDMTYNRFSRALKRLRSLNLIVAKKAKDGEDLLELHPLVRTFVRSRFTRLERSSIIETIWLVYSRAMGLFRVHLDSRPSLAVLENWSQAAELDVQAGKIERAVGTLADAAASFERNGYYREFVRVTRKLLASFDWKDLGNATGFEAVFRLFVESLGYLGENDELEDALDSFEAILPEKNARYVFFCEVRCYCNWLRGNFTAAVEWGKKGKELVTSSGLAAPDHLEHSLALAERDAGTPEIAINFFLRGHSLASVIAPAELDQTLWGAFYGNIGRCLHFMEQMDSALICYQKSAILLERERTSEQAVNDAYIRRWIGELLIARGETRLGAIFLEASRRKWEQYAPSRALQVHRLQQLMDPTLTLEVQTLPVEGTCRDWILGRKFNPKEL